MAYETILAVPLLKVVSQLIYCIQDWPYIEAIGLRSTATRTSQQRLHNRYIRTNLGRMTAVDIALSFAENVRVKQ